MLMVRAQGPTKTVLIVMFHAPLLFGGLARRSTAAFAGTNGRVPTTGTSIVRSRATPISSLQFLFASSSSSSVDGCPLEFEELPYRGAEVRLPVRDQLLGDNGAGADGRFLDELRSSLKYWAENDYTSAWLHIPTSRAGLLETLTSKAATDTSIESLSFDLHHVNATESTIVLKKWLRPNAEDKIPPFASHQVGCAGFVLSEDNELLLVREWTGTPSNRTPTKQWKLPGGLLDAGESFEEATCREVYEETGVPCEFESVLSFWHRHGLVFGKSDFYYVSLLNPVKKDINIDPVEVSACKWTPLDEFLQTQDHPLILHVLEMVFGLKNDEESLETLRTVRERIRPKVEIVEGDIRFGNRDPFPTYTGRISGSSS
jgi:8-oxo-dGTP pyrophosphatase MutT (NUDIX family)